MSGADFGALDLPALLRTVPAPVLIILGDLDRFVSVASCADLNAAIEGRANRKDALEIVPGAGHGLPREDPAALVTAIQAA